MTHPRPSPFDASVASPNDHQFALFAVETSVPRTLASKEHVRPSLAVKIADHGRLHETAVVIRPEDWWSLGPQRRAVDAAEGLEFDLDHAGLRARRQNPGDHVSHT